MDKSIELTFPAPNLRYVSDNQEGKWLREADLDTGKLKRENSVVIVMECFHDVSRQDEERTWVSHKDWRISEMRTGIPGTKKGLQISLLRISLKHAILCVDF